METYWILEYGKVFLGYMFLMFLWPSVVFRKHLKDKNARYSFSFCVTIQILIINTVVLMLGLFHVLNKRLIVIMFYGVFMWSVSRHLVMIKSKRVASCNIRRCKVQIEKFANAFWKAIHPRIEEYLLLLIVVTFGVVFFSYGVLQIYTYGAPDMSHHHEWVNSLVKGVIFPEGVYPEAMHCFIYCLNALFGIRIYSIIKFLQCIHLIVFFISVYCLLREIFCWRYSPIFVLALYLTLDFNRFMYSMYRFASTLSMEFGLYTQFLCGLYLLRYIKGDGYDKQKGTGGWRDDNLRIFMLSLAASIMIHFHTTIMAFILCLSIAIFSIKKILRLNYLVPLFIATMVGCIVAMMPMAGALVSGIPFEASIYWGLQGMQAANDDVSQESANDSPGLLDPNADDLEVIEKLPDSGQKLVRGIIRVEKLIKEIYEHGYKLMYGKERGRRIFQVTIIVIGLCIIGRSRFGKQIGRICKGYPPIILISICSMLIVVTCNISGLGIPQIIPGSRHCSSGHVFILGVLWMPIDLMFSMAVVFVKDQILRVISVVLVGVIYIATKWFGIFHTFPYCKLMEYEAAVIVTNSIIKEFPEKSYTIISPKEELCQVELYGNHEEISEFVNRTKEDDYSISTENIFIYVEKKPIVYWQLYNFQGPAWLGQSRDNNIEAYEISAVAAQEDLSEYASINQIYSGGRVILESKAYEWCRSFEERYPNELIVYYEDENFVCYYIKQDMDKPYNLGIGK